MSRIAIDDKSFAMDICHCYMQIKSWIARKVLFLLSTRCSMSAPS